MTGSSVAGLLRGSSVAPPMTSAMTSRFLATTRSAATLARSGGRPCSAPASPSLIRLPQRRLFQGQPIPPQFQQFSSPPPPPPPPPRKSIFRIFTLNRTLFLTAAALTYFAGARILNTKLGERLSLDIPATPEGVQLTASIQREMLADTDKMDIVQQCKSDPAWEEWAMGPNGGPASEESSSDNTGRVRLTTGPMGGLDGMGGCHRIFRNTTTGEIVSVIYIGAKLAGWPMVVHGGALATILDEALGRCAITLFEAGTAVTARLELTYRRKSLTSNYVAVFCTPAVSPDELGPGAKLNRRKLWCDARLAPIDRDGRTGDTNVEARALFVVPQSYVLPKVKQMF